MCNAHNHPPGCTCGFGGFGHFGGGIQSWAYDFIQRYHEDFEPRTLETTCPWCSALVYYHTNGFGDSVYFDELGPPWPIHSCYKVYRQARQHIPHHLVDVLLSSPALWCFRKEDLLQAIEAASPNLSGRRIIASVISISSDPGWEASHLIGVWDERAKSSYPLVTKRPIPKGLQPGDMIMASVHDQEFKGIFEDKSSTLLIAETLAACGFSDGYGIYYSIHPGGQFVVDYVWPGSPASVAGVMQNDRFITIDNQAEDVEESFLIAEQEQRVLQVRAMRGAESISFELVPGAYLCERTGGG